MPNKNEYITIKSVMKDKGGLIAGCCKIAGFVLVFFPGPGPYAAQPEVPAEKGRLALPETDAVKGRNQKPEKKQKEKEKKGKSVFIPSEKISSDTPVSFPADI